MGRAAAAAPTLAAMLMGSGAAAHGASRATVLEPDQQSDVKVMEEVEVSEARERELASPKFTVPIRDVPQTVTVIPRRIIEEQGANSLRDVLRNSPGITFQAGEGGTPAGDQMTIRGFSARTDMFIDGVRDLGGYARDSFNLEQVEVAKGPSSAVSGRGSTGGSVNLVSKSPQALAFTRAAIGVGTDDYLRGTVDVNQPLNSTGSVAARVNLLSQDAGVPGRDVVENKSIGVAPSVAFGIGSPTQLTFAYQRLEQNNIPDYGQPRQVYTYDPAVPLSNFYGLKQRDYEDITQDLGTITVDHKMGETFRIRNLTRYGRTYRDSVITAPRFLSGSDTIIRRNDWKSRDQTDEVLSNQTNLNATFETGAVTHQIAAGVEFAREDEKNYTRVEDPATVLPETDVYHPNPDDAYTGHITRNGAYNATQADSTGVYAFDTLHFGEKWELTGGLRWDDFDATQRVVDETGVEEKYSRSDDNISSRLGLVFKPITSMSVYAGYGNSFNPSAEGLSLTTRGGSLEDVPPEETNSYEAGVKWDAVEGRLALTAAVFRTEKTNARTAGIDPNDPPQVLDGEQKVDGLEFSAAGRITREWEIFAGLALMDSEVVASNDGDEGQELGITPKTTFNLWTTYALPAGFSIGGGANYQSNVYRSTSDAQALPDYWIFSAMAAWQANDHLTLRLNVTNVFDEEYIDRIGGGHHIPGLGRQAILTANLSF